MIDYFSSYGIAELVHADDAHAHLKQSRSLLAHCIRGREVINVFREAKRRWALEPCWQEKALECINAFGESRTADASQVAMLPSLFDDTAWEAKCANELNLPRALDSVYEGARTDAILAYRPLGVVLHVSPGNSFLGGVDSMLHGIVTGNQNIVKVSRHTPAVISVVLDLLHASGLPQGQVVPLLWEGGNKEIESVLCAGVDGVIAWGGDATIQQYKTRLPIGVRFLEYGPKLSFSLLSLQGNKESLAELVKDVCAYEQASCSSSQFLLVEMPENESDNPAFQQQLLTQLSQLFSAYATHTPPAQKTKHEQVEMLKALERAKLHKVMARGDYVSGYPDWLVVWMGDEKPIQPSPLFRTWLIYPYQHKQQLLERLLPIRHYLQTAGVACGADELSGIADLLWSAGVNRVVTPGRSCTPTHGAPHDGGSILAGLCRITSLETEESTRCLWKAGTKEETLQALHEIVTASRRAPFYEQSEKHANFCKRPTWEAFYALPWLTKNDFYLYGPPKSSDLLTIPFEKARRAYLITTGGSTGEPKYANGQP